MPSSWRGNPGAVLEPSTTSSPQRHRPPGVRSGLRFPGVLSEPREPKVGAPGLSLTFSAAGWRAVKSSRSPAHTASQAESRLRGVCGFQGASLKHGVRCPGRLDTPGGLRVAVPMVVAPIVWDSGIRNPHRHWAHPASALPASAVFSGLPLMSCHLWAASQDGRVRAFPRAAVTRWVPQALITATPVVAL